MRLPLLLCASTFLFGACSGGSSAPHINLVTDANRSGLIEMTDPTEDPATVAWTSTSGAILLANIDDDDGDGMSDAEDDKINGPDDILDFSPLVLAAWPHADKHAQVTLDVAPIAASAVRVFQLTAGADATQPDSYTLVTLPLVLTGEALRTETRFIVEGTTVVTSIKDGAFDGHVTFTARLDDKTAKSHKVETTEGGAGADSAIMRIAPVMFQYNTAPTKKVFYSDEGDSTQSLADGIAPAAMAAGAMEQGLDLSVVGVDDDVWMQDFIDFAVMSRPAIGGGVQQIRVAIHSAQPDRDAGNIAMVTFRGHDYGSIYLYDMNGSVSDASYSMNSYGNYDVIPPYTNGADSYPLGRNVWGSTGNPKTSPDLVYQDFMRAQRVQPEVNLDTSWLFVGHVDEFSSYVKSSSARGWALLIADPTRAHDMLKSMSDAGNGAVHMFAGKKQYDYNTGAESSAERSIDDVLGDADLMAASQLAATRIEANLVTLKTAIGLADDEVFNMPGLFDDSMGGSLAYIPGTVNLLHMDGKLVIPDPFGPIIDGKDPFKTDLETRLQPIGLEIHYADDWYTYHLNAGEVHCGSNVERDMPLAWWGTGR